MIECRKCWVHKAKRNFYKNAKYKMGYKPICKKCILTRQRELYHLKRKEEPKIVSAISFLDGKEKIVEQMRNEIKVEDLKRDIIACGDGDQASQTGKWQEKLRESRPTEQTYDWQSVGMAVAYSPELLDVTKDKNSVSLPQFLKQDEKPSFFTRILNFFRRKS